MKSIIDRIKIYDKRRMRLRKIAHKIQIRSWGTWLYRKSILKWITFPDYKKQLPFLYQVFAFYCKIWIAIFNIEEIIGSRPLLSILIQIQKIISRKNSTLLNFSDIQLYLNLEDPRFLAVGNELSSGDIKKMLSLLLKMGDTFVDIGANQGAYSLIASRIVGESGQIISIEPQPQLALNIKKSLELYSKCKFQVFQSAVGDTNGTIELIVPKSSSGSAGIYKDHSGLDRHSQISVPIIRFDDSIDWQEFSRSVFLKLDIEGAEFAFLNGAATMLKTTNPTLMIEINPMSLKVSGTSFKDLVALLTEFGFSHYRHINNFETFYKLEELKSDIHQNILISKSNRSEDDRV